MDGGGPVPRSFSHPDRAGWICQRRRDACRQGKSPGLRSAALSKDQRLRLHARIDGGVAIEDRRLGVSDRAGRQRDRKVRSGEIRVRQFRLREGTRRPDLVHEGPEAPQPGFAFHINGEPGAACRHCLAAACPGGDDLFEVGPSSGGGRIGGVAGRCRVFPVVRDHLLLSIPGHVLRRRPARGDRGRRHSCDGDLRSRVLLHRDAGGRHGSGRRFRRRLRCGLRGEHSQFLGGKSSERS